MRRLAAFAVTASLLGTITAPVWAAGECPDGDWFCEPAPAAAPAPAESGPAPDAAPAPPQRGRRNRPPPAFEPPGPPPPGFEDDPRMRIDVEPMPPPRPRHRHRRGFREWGVNLHANIGLLGKDEAMSPNADMNGLGGALRFRPIPHIAIEGAVELLWGTDYNGFQRSEQALLVNGLFYANPRSAVQLYGLVGFGLGAASLDSGLATDGQPVLRDESYSYRGGQLGIGVEGRVTRHFVLGGDLLGFMRWRNDRGRGGEPEFVDPITHRATNTSAGGLLRLGATFYW